MTIELEGGYDVRPIGDRVLVQVFEQPEMTPGGVYLPDDARRKRQYGRVVYIGDEINTPKRTTRIEPGDYVAFPAYAGLDITLENEQGLPEKFLILEYKSIIAKLIKRG